MKIEVGKFYKTRDGRKVRIYATDAGNSGNCIHGAIENNGKWHQYEAFYNGRWLSTETETYHDIVAEWTESPIVKDWSVFPEWIIALAKCEKTNEWLGFTAIPETHNNSPFGWVIDRPDCDYEAVLPIRYDHHPTFSGDWKDSLVTRPGYKETK